MYSVIPVPQVAWDKKPLAWALCAFPLVGIVIGAALYSWLRLWDWLDLGMLGAAGAALLPIALSGGIHMDGFCDTCDALASRQSRARKLEILKDSHTGAFASICCAAYLVLLTAAWAETEPSAALALGPVLSRCLSALAAVSFHNARGSGLLAAFTAPMDTVRARIVLLLATGGTAAALIAFDPLSGGAALIAAGAAFFFYFVMAYRQFGGITGDTEGWFLQVCELLQVLAIVLARKAAALV